MRYGIYIRCQNEKNIIEFMKHYYNLGFSFILIWDDCSTVPVNNIIENWCISQYNDNIWKKQNMYKIFTYPSNNLDFLKKYSLLNSKEFFCNNILKLIKSNMDYCLYIDADEYLYIKNNLKINQLVKKYEPFEKLKIHWVLFGNNNIINNDDTHLKDVYTRSSDIISPTYKVIVNVKNIVTCDTPHNFETNPTNLAKCTCHKMMNKHNNFYCNINNLKEHVNRFNINNIDCYLAHYCIQSTNNFIKRKEYLFLYYILQKNKSINITELKHIYKQSKSVLLDAINTKNKNKLKSLQYSYYFTTIYNIYNMHNKNNIKNDNLKTSNLIK